MLRRRRPRPRGEPVPSPPEFPGGVAARSGLVSASGWLSAALIGLVVFAPCTAVLGLMQHAPSARSATLISALWYAVGWSCAGLHALFCVQAQRTRDRPIQALAAGALVGAVAFSLGLLALLGGERVSRGIEVVFLTPAAAALTLGCSTLILARLLRTLGAKTSSWVATSLGGLWLVHLTYLAFGLGLGLAGSEAGRREVAVMGTVVGALLLVPHCIIGSVLLLSFRGLLRRETPPVDSTRALAEPGWELAGVLVALCAAVALTLAPIGMFAASHLERCAVRLVEREVPADWQSWPLESVAHDRRLGAFALLYDEHNGSRAPAEPVGLKDPSRCKGSSVDFHRLEWPIHASEIRLRRRGEEFIASADFSSESGRDERLLVAFRRAPDGSLGWDEDWVKAPLEFAQFFLVMPLLVLLLCCLAELRAARRVFHRRGLITYAEGELLPNGLVQLADGTASWRWRGAHPPPGPVLVSPDVVAGARGAGAGEPFRTVPDATRGVVGGSREEAIARGRQAMVRARRLARASLLLGIFTLLTFLPVMFW